MSELRGLGEVNEEIKQKGGQLWAIAVDGQADAKRVMEKQDLAFPILCDVEQEVIAAYDLVHENAAPGGGNMAIPATILIEKGGKIVWKHIARLIQDRPDPSVVLEQVRSLPST